MPQSRLHLEAPEAEARRAAAAVEAELGEEEYAVALFETDAAKGLWSLSVYAEADRAGALARRIAAAFARAGIDRHPAVEPIGQENWVARSLAGLPPVRVGRFLVHGGHDAGAPRAGDHAILIEAGEAFGTGHHGTTAGCLGEIALALRKRNFSSCLDLGTGSGVLAIALAKARRAPVLASDIDPVSVRVARANARLNGVAPLVACVRAAGFAHPAIARRAPFDLIVANILAGPLAALAPGFRAHAAPDATVILSGLLATQRARILAAFRLQGFVHRRSLLRDGWLTLTLAGSRRLRRRG
jgi:ribosomal protein L11 methyltransferase